MMQDIAKIPSLESFAVFTEHFSLLSSVFETSIVVECNRNTSPLLEPSLLKLWSLIPVEMPRKQRTKVFFDLFNPIHSTKSNSHNQWTSLWILRLQGTTTLTPKPTVVPKRFCANRKCSSKCRWNHCCVPRHFWTTNESFFHENRLHYSFGVNQLHSICWPEKLIKNHWWITAC